MIFIAENKILEVVKDAGNRTPTWGEIDDLLPKERQNSDEQSDEEEELVTRVRSANIGDPMEEDKTK